MSAYQLLKQFQDEVQKLTGVRPDVSITITSYNTNFTEEDVSLIRNTLVADSDNELKTTEVQLEDPSMGKWMCFKGMDWERSIHLSVHGPKRKEAQPCTK